MFCLVYLFADKRNLTVVHPIPAQFRARREAAADGHADPLPRRGRGQRCLLRDGSHENLRRSRKQLMSITRRQR